MMVDFSRSSSSGLLERRMAQHQHTGNPLNSWRWPLSLQITFCAKIRNRAEITSRALSPIRGDQQRAGAAAHHWTNRLVTLHWSRGQLRLFCWTPKPLFLVASTTPMEKNRNRNESNSWESFVDDPRLRFRRLNVRCLKQEFCAKMRSLAANGSKKTEPRAWVVAPSLMLQSPKVDGMELVKCQPTTSRPWVKSWLLDDRGTVSFFCQVLNRRSRLQQDENEQGF